MSLNGESPFGAAGRPETIPVSACAPGAGHLALPWLRPIKDPAEARQVLAAAAADQDSLVRPSHLVELGGEIVGAVSMGSVLLLDVWAHREKMKARNSLVLLNLIENLAAGNGVKVLCLPCTLRSPYRPYMEKFGYRYAGEAGMFYKQLG